ncbi:MAG: glycosyltransferase family 4 protein [Myxococcales bacterium]|nr:glycosyltransferase family 4 protein [Myxococcales bacterium]
MRHSVHALESLCAGAEAMVVSLDAPRYDETQGNLRLLGVPLPAPLHPKEPARLRYLRWAMRVVPLMRAFSTDARVDPNQRPSWGRLVLEEAILQRLPTLLVFANTLTMDRGRPPRILELARDPVVHRVANFRRIATDAMVELGLPVEKALAYAFPEGRSPADYETKVLSPPPHSVLFAGRLIEEKGASDVIGAVRELRSRGRDVSLTILGQGPFEADLRQLAKDAPKGLITFAGQVPNTVMFDMLRRSTVAVVPTRPEFMEGMPMSLTEGLISRTPLVISNHIVFTRSFRDREGVLIAEAKSPSSFASCIDELISNAELYSTMSSATEAAYARVACDHTFEDVLMDWRAETFPTHVRA